MLKTNSSPLRLLLIVILAILPLSANWAVEQHRCNHPDHGSTCAFCSLAFSPAAAIGVITLVVLVCISVTVPASVTLLVVAAFPASFDCRAPPAA